jgi:hypothetical protein
MAENPTAPKKKTASKAEAPLRSQIATSNEAVDFELLPDAVLTLRGQKVVLDSDLAKVFGTETKRLNEAIKRNADRFGGKYAFRLTDQEWSALRSRTATSNSGRGGRRYPPRVFTEYGVVMAATVLDSEKAIEASKLVIDVFIAVKRSLDGQETALAVVPRSERAKKEGSKSLAQLDGFWQDMGPRLQTALDHVLDSVIDHKKQSTIREEAQTLISESITHLKDRLKKTGLENEELAAKATKLLAEAEKEKSIAARTRAETEALEFQTIVKKLRLLIEAQRAMAQNEVDGFLNVLKELGE